jgi:hypothetical protein
VSYVRGMVVGMAAVSSILCIVQSSALMYVVWKVAGCSCLWLHVHYAYADHVNLLGDNRDTMHKNRNLVVLEVNIKKTKHMLVSRDQNPDQNWNLKIANRSWRMPSSGM